MRKYTALIVYTIFVLTFGTIIYFVNGKISQNALNEQMLHREQIISRSGALSISNFLDLLANNLSTLALDDSLTKKDFETFIDVWKDTPVEGVAMIAKNGMVSIDINKYKSTQEKYDASDRAYFKWAVDNKVRTHFIGNPVISKFGNTTGEYVIPVSANILDDNGQFQGVVIAVVNLDEMVKKYSNPLKISDKTLIYLLDSDGNFVFSPIKNLQGKSYLEWIKDFNFPLKDQIIADIENKFGDIDDEGKFNIVAPDMLNNNKLTRFLSAYAPVKIDREKNWVLVITTPSSDASTFLYPIYNNQFYALTIFVFVVLGYAILIVNRVYYAERKGYEKGIREGRNQI